MGIKIRLLARILGAIFVFSGCASSIENSQKAVNTSIETSKKLMGTSTEALEAAKAGGKHEVFDFDYPTCYKKVVSILKKNGAYLFLHSAQRHRIVAMNFKKCNDTTAVGIFFKEAGPASTEITLSCLSPSVLETASLLIFTALKEKDIPKKDTLK